MSSTKKFIRSIHRWLGLLSGLVVFVVAITGCIYTFKDEIQQATQSYRFVIRKNSCFLQPSAIIEIADKELPGKQIHAVMYFDSLHAAKAIYYSYAEHYYDFVYINPYTGEVLKVKDELSDFFRIVLDGHFYLWLPPEIGQPIVAFATLIFFVLLVTGIILWWPRNKKGLKRKFRIKWNGAWRRKNYDLHSVIGFYVSWLALVLVVTGLVWGFQWFRNGLYAVTSGGKEFVDYYTPQSDTLKYVNNETQAIDKVWLKMVKEYPEAQSIEVHPPANKMASIAANANPDVSTYWKTDYRYFDQYTLEELPVAHMWGRFKQSTSAERLMRMNYDIHVGAILGVPGKILAFLVSLTIASLPITGLVLWIGRKNKHSRKGDS